MAELHHAVALAAGARGGHHPVPAGRNGAVTEALQHQAGVEDHPTLRRCGRLPAAIHLHLKAGGGGPGQGGDQVDVGMGGGPEMPGRRRGGHGGIADRAGEGGGLVHHLLEEGFGAAHPEGDHPQEAPLQVGEGSMKALQHRRDPRHHRLREHGLWIEHGIAAPQRMAAGQRR